MLGMDAPNDSCHHLVLAPSGGEDHPHAEPLAVDSGLLELLDAESRLLAQAVGEHLPLELALRVGQLRAQHAALEHW